MVVVKGIFIWTPLDGAVVVCNLAVVFAQRFERFDFEAPIKDGVKLNVAGDCFQFRVVHFNLRDAFVDKRSFCFFLQAFLKIH